MIFTLILLLLVFGINCFLIPIYGIIGAAISTGIAMVVYNICRMLFLFYCYKIHPFEKNQLYVIGLFFSILIIFSNIPDFSRNGLVVLIFKSIFISIVYLGIIILFKLNKDLNAYIYNVLSSKFRLKLNFLNQ